MTYDALVSIVMPSFNQVEFLGRSIDSVLQQDYPNLELIIADGGSTDGSVELLKCKSEQYPQLSWTSETDSGPAAALNKALAQVRGVIIGWLNSDDLYVDGAIHRAVDSFAAHPDWLLCYGKAEHIDAEDNYINDYPTRTPDVGLDAFANGCFICQPSMFFKASVRTLLGNLDETYKTSFDYDYWLRAFQAFPERIGFIPELQAQSRLHDACITVNMRRTVAVEGTQLTYKYLGRGVPHWIVTYLEQVRVEYFARGAKNEFQQHAAALLEEVATCFEENQLEQIRTAMIA